MSSEGYELFALPLETIIGINEGITSRRSSLQSESSSNKSNSKGLGELRKKFETFLSQDALKHSLQSNLQKLLFLDHFYDCKRKRSIKFQKHSEIFQNCNSLLSCIVHLANEQILVNSEKESFLSQFKMIVEENGSLFPLFKNRSLFDLFATQQELMNTKQVKQGEENLLESQEDNVLEMLVYMFSNHFKYMFYYFQKTESKFAHEWMKLNLSSLPKFILDDLKIKHETTQAMKDLLAYKEDELTSTTIVDADFDFLNFLSTNKGDCKLLSNLSNISDIQLYTSNENYMCTPKSKVFKMVVNVDASIEEFSKAYLKSDHPKEKEGHFREYLDYEPMVSNNSSRKYSLVKGKLFIESRIPLMDDRVSDAVFTSRPKFIGNKLVESTELFKTTSSFKNNKKCIAIGGNIIRKVDETKCQFIQLAMVCLSGILQSDIVIEKVLLKLHSKTIKSFIARILEKKPDDSNNPKLIWKTFCDYCQTYCNINADENLSELK